jgi:hypothetical protein
MNAWTSARRRPDSSINSRAADSTFGSWLAGPFGRRINLTDVRGDPLGAHRGVPGAAWDFRSGRALLLDRRSDRADRLADPRDGSDDAANGFDRLCGPLR